MITGRSTLGLRTVTTGRSTLGLRSVYARSPPCDLRMTTELITNNHRTFYARSTGGLRSVTTV